MWFISYSSVFTTTLPSTLTDKLLMLALIPSLCSWIMDFLISRTQSVSIGPLSSKTLIMNTGCPQGCVLSQGQTGDQGYRGNPRWADRDGVVQNTSPLPSPTGPPSDIAGTTISYASQNTYN